MATWLRHRWSRKVAPSPVIDHQKIFAESIARGQWGLSVDGVGARRSIGSRDVVDTTTADRGCVVYGPYIDLEAGHYVVDFTIERLARSPVYRDRVVAVVNVARDGGDGIVVRSNVYSSHLDRGRPITLAFDLDGPAAAVEFRVEVTGQEALRIDLERPLATSPESRTAFHPVLAGRETITDGTFLSNVDHLRSLHENGCSVDVTPEGTKLVFQGIAFYLRSLEDIQLANEVFVSHDYFVASGRDVVAIDVGMNVGLASLYLASLPRVRAVHSFEPFPRPFDRALEHFALNPHLSQKIRPHRFGLGGRDEELTVQVIDGNTIGNSIRGLSEGVQTVITVRDAAPKFARICEEAEKSSLDVIVKLDCEGSEFAILERLDEEGLLPRISAFMMEWHKWWSADLTSQTIVERLTRNGFFVFDKTRATPDQLAGHIYAVRGLR